MKFRTALLPALCCCALGVAAQTQPSEAAAPAATRTPAGAVPVAAAPVRRPDERRPEQPFTVDLFGRQVELALSYEVANERRRNFDLDATSQRDRSVLDHELKLDARWRAGESVTLFAQIVGLSERRKERSDGSVRQRDSVERGQAWVLAEQLAGLPMSLQVGRIALIERRSWWWDDDLDAARLSFVSGDWRLDTGLAREVARVSSALPGIDPAAKGLTRWFGHGGYEWAQRQTIESFWLIANDRSGAPPAGTLFAADSEDRSDARLRWFGLRASGEWRDESGHRLGYRADAALLRGRETRTSFNENTDGSLSAADSAERRVRGHAFDVGGQWRLPGAARPTFTLALASGSGGIDSDAQDHNFRQTGLQENKGRIAGVKRLRYYGELLDPELSNLRIVSAGFGLRFLSNSSAEVLLHDYRQQLASTRLAGSRLSEDPEGLSRAIGREIDLSFAMREWQHVELTLKLARFRPGAAFAAERRDPASSFELGAVFNF